MFASNSAQGGTNAQLGSELHEYSSDELGWLGLNKEVKLKLNTDKWPEGQPPPPTSSLLSISQTKGLLAAGSHKTVTISTTDRVRAAFEGEASAGIRAFDPNFTLSLSTRISQVAFSSDGAWLVMSAEDGGGLAVYSVDGFQQGDFNSKFELSTNSSSLRQLIANPAPEFAELFAVVTAKGELLVADMKVQSFRTGQGNVVYQTGVSTVAWSVKGKALLAGSGDGSLVQIMADGKKSAGVPRPPDLAENHHVSRISWLGNDLAVIAYTPDNTEPSFPEPTAYYVMERSGPAGPNRTHTFSKFDEVGILAGPRVPNVQFMSTISKYHNIEHLVVVSQTGTEDVCVLVKSQVSLANDAPAGAFSVINNESRRAALPLTEGDFSSTFPVGMVFDFTSDKLVPRPVAGSADICEKSPSPLPALMILNTEGVLSAWWLVFSDAMIKGVDFPGLTRAGPYKMIGQRDDDTAVQADAERTDLGGKKPASAFGTSPAPAFGQSSTLGQSAAPSFGTAPAPAFGQASMPGRPAAPAFGAPSMPGTAQPPAFGQSGFAGAKPTFGASSFGTQQSATSTKFPTSSGATFGSASKLGQSSPFGQPAADASKSTFGSPGTLGSTPKFGQSTFGQPPADGSKPTFGSPGTLGSTPKFGQPAFGQPPADASKSAFGATSTFGGQQTANAAAQPASPFSAVGGTSSAPAFGASAKPAFGAPSKPGHNMFGTPLVPEDRPNPFGAPSFGQAANQNPFGAAPPTAPSGGTAGSNKSASPAPPVNPFSIGANKTNSNPFGARATFGSSSPLGQKPSPFGTLANDTTKSSSPLRNEGFSRPSAFADKAEKPSDSTTSTKDTGKSLFGRGFGDALADSSKAATETQNNHEEDMDDNNVDDDEHSEDSGDEDDAPSLPVSPDIIPSTTPKDTPAVQKMGVPSFPIDNDLDSTPKAQPGKTNTLVAAQSKDQGPLPPDTQKIAESAPLPPDPVKFKAKFFDNDLPPLPPNPVQSKSSKSTSGSADPMKPPPKPLSTSRNQNPFAPKSVPESPLDDEGSGIDVANEFSSENSPESSFLSKDSATGVFAGKGIGSFKPPAPKGASVFASVPTTNVPKFELPSKSEHHDDSDSLSLRSPSPVRPPRNTGSARAPAPSSPDASRKSVSQKSRAFERFQQSQSKQKIVSPISSAVQASMEKERRLAEARAQAQQKAEEQELSDEDDEYFRAQLEAPIEPVVELPSFVAHTDYVGEGNKEGIPGQIEIIYRDANSMVDTLGLNLRSIKSWVQGHLKTGHSRRAARLEDLDSLESWTMADIQRAETLREELESDLASGCVVDISQTLKACKEVNGELGRIKKRNGELAKTVKILKQKDSDTTEAESASLSAAQSEAQQDLRRAFADFRSSLAAAEEGVTVLRAKLATQSSNGTGPQAPTAEAIERTINKMTAMTEKKSADIEVLAAQLKKLGFVERPSSSRQGRRSRSGSPFGTPTPAFTPRSSRLNNSLNLADGMKQLVLSSEGASEGMSEEVIQRYTARLKQRKAVNEVLKQTLGSGKPRIRPLYD